MKGGGSGEDGRGEGRKCLQSDVCRSCRITFIGVMYR